MWFSLYLSCLGFAEFLESGNRVIHQFWKVLSHYLFKITSVHYLSSLLLEPNAMFLVQSLFPHVLHMLLLLLSRVSRVRLFPTPWTAVHQAPPPMGFSRQEHWSGVPLPSLFAYVCASIWIFPIDLSLSSLIPSSVVQFDVKAIQRVQFQKSICIFVWILTSLLKCSIFSSIFHVSLYFL